MRYDFSTVEDVESYATLPEGVHLCRVAEIREGHSRDGSLQWNYRLEAAEGEHAGRTAAWDTITWSERGIHRVKHVLGCLGLDVRGVVELEAADLIGRTARVSLVLEEREDALRNRRVVRLRVPYLGYEAAGEPAPIDAWGAAAGSSGHEPFGGDSARARSAAGEAG